MDHVTSFASAKTVSPVPYTSEITRLALIRATLDPLVVAIRPAASHEVVPGIVATVCDARGVACVLRVTEADRENMHGDRSGTLAYDRTELTTLAILLDSVWACRRRLVSAGDRIRILHHLDEHGTTPLVEVAQAASASTDGVAAVLALACQGAVALDLDAPLGPETRVRRCRVDA